MDKETQDLLELWGCPQLVEVFKNDEIGLDVLKANAITDEYLKEHLKPGPRLLLLSKIKQFSLKGSQPPPEVENTDLALTIEESLSDLEPENDDEPAPSPAKKPRKSKAQTSNVDFATKRAQEFSENRLVKNLDLLSLLQSDKFAKVVLETYQSKPEGERSLPERGRKVILNCVATHLIGISKDLKNDHICQVSKGLVNIFKTETLGTYYIPPNTYNKQPIAKGRLTYKYRNKKTALTKLQHFEVNEGASTSSCEAPVAGNPYQWLLDYVEDPSATDARISAEQWLKHQNSPWPEVLAKWRLTAALRLQDLISDRGAGTKAQGSETEEARETRLLGHYFDTHTLLRHSSGFQLLCEDFEFMFKEEANNLYLHWENFENKLIELAKESVTDKFGLEAIASLNSSNIDKETRIVTLLSLLPSVCPPQARLKTSQGRLWKVSIADSRQGFILQVPALADLRTAIKRRGEKLQHNKQRCQPFLAVVGCQKSYFCVDKVVYHCHNTLSALDSCFKSFFALHAQYPRESEQIWLMIQRCLYRIKTPYDNLGVANLEQCISRLM